MDTKIRKVAGVLGSVILIAVALCFVLKFFRVEK